MTHLRTAAALMALGTAFAARAQTAATPAPEAATAPAATPAPAAATAPKTSFSGKVFADYSYRDNMNYGTDRARADSGTAFDLKRAYVTVDHSFDSTFGARLRTDASYNGAVGNTEVFIKNAYLEAKVAPELVIRAGSADLPWVPFAEDLYGFRFVENELVDRAKFGTSADFGLHLGGKLADGLASYAVSVTNGRGYKDPTRTQAPAVEARVSVVPVKGLTIALGGQATKLGQNVVASPSVPRTASRVQALVAYVDGPLRLGAEGFYGHDYDAKVVVTTAKPQDKALGGSVWASYEVVPSLTAFGRFDMVQPNRDTKSSLKDRYFNLGASYKAAKPLDVALVFKREIVDNGQLGYSNGTVGSTTAGHGGGLDEVGVFAQYSF